MQDTFARAGTWPKGKAKRARDDRVSCIQMFIVLIVYAIDIIVQISQI